jgi:hypothetical protein
MQSRVGVGLNQTSTWVFAATFLATFLLPSIASSQSSTNPNETNTVSPTVSARPLDGRQFNVHIVRDDAGKDGKNRGLGDQLTFSNEKFSSAICKKYNFAEAPYWVRIEGDRVHFLAELASPTDGTMRWEGTMRGDTLEATMRWTKTRWYWKIDTTHKISGTLMKGLTAASPSSN